MRVSWASREFLISPLHSLAPNTVTRATHLSDRLRCHNATAYFVSHETQMICQTSAAWAHRDMSSVTRNNDSLSQEQSGAVIPCCMLTLASLTVVGGDCMEGGTTTGKGRHATQVELRLGFDTSHTFLTHFLRPQAYCI